MSIHYAVIEKEDRDDGGRTVDSIIDPESLADWISKHGTHGKIYEIAPVEFDGFVQSEPIVVKADQGFPPKSGRMATWFRALF